MQQYAYKMDKMQKEHVVKVMELKQISNTHRACQATVVETFCSRFGFLNYLPNDISKNEANSDRVVEALGLLCQLH